jgi:hypothetical protein
MLALRSKLFQQLLRTSENKRKLRQFLSGDKNVVVQIDGVNYQLIKVPKAGACK